MDDSPLKAALKKLLAHGDAATDSKLTRMAAAKKAPTEMCPDCKEAPLVDGRCGKCGYAAPQDESGDLADLLEQGGQEG